MLARTGSFTHAARALFLTQSAISHTIRALEEEIECRLFTRTGRGATVTEAGKHFLQYTEKIVAEMETARTLVAPRMGRGMERLRVGVSIRAQELIMPTVLPTFQREFPRKLVVLERGDYGRNLELLSAGLLDFAFSVRPPGRPELSFVPLFEDELRLIVSPKHPWARRGLASWDELAAGYLVTYLKLNATPSLLDEYFKLEGMTLGHGVGLNDRESIKELALSGLAAGVMAPWMAKPELESGSLVSLPLGPRPLTRQWGLVYFKKHRLALMEERFVELCQSAVPGLLSRLQGQTAGPHLNESSSAVPLADARLGLGPAVRSA